MKNILARSISIGLHPLLIPTYSFLILFLLKSYISYSLPTKVKMSLLSILILNTFILPVVMFYFMKLRGLISDFNMTDKKERILPYIVTALFFYSTFYLFKKFALPSVLYFVLFGSTCLVIITLIINFWWKISAHMIAMGGLVGSFISIAFFLKMNIGGLIALMILTAGIVGYARLKLNVHTPAQVYTGFIVGSSFMGLLFFLLI